MSDALASLYIKTTIVSDGTKRYAVKYRRAGRYSNVEHAGTFKTQRDALTRKAKVGEWLAAGFNPKVELQRALEPPMSMSQACASWLASRRSVSEATRANYGARIRRIEEDLEMAPAALTVADINAWVGDLGDDYQPGTIALFLSTLRQVLDHADVTPNVARDRRIELPRRVRTEVRPPTADEFLAVLRRTSAKYRPVVVLLEQTGMRVSEAVTQPWDEVDLARGRLLVSADRSKTGRARWVEVADWMLEALGDPKGARVFPGMTRQKVYNAIRSGCEAAGVDPFGPHALRHRRASILHDRMSPARAAEMLGHTTEEHLRTYAHVMPVQEVPVQDLVSLLR